MAHKPLKSAGPTAQKCARGRWTMAMAIVGLATRLRISIGQGQKLAMFLPQVDLRSAVSPHAAYDSLPRFSGCSQCAVHSMFHFHCFLKELPTRLEHAQLKQCSIPEMFTGVRYPRRSFFPRKHSPTKQKKTPCTKPRPARGPCKSTPAFGTGLNIVLASVLLAPVRNAPTP